MIGAMTGPWLIVKWMGIAVLLLYTTIVAVAILRFRNRVTGMRRGLYLPMIVGIFVSLSLPSIFENAVFTRVCFVIAQAIFIAGIVILVRRLMQRGSEGSLRAGG